MSPMLETISSGEWKACERKWPVQRKAKHGWAVGGGGQEGDQMDAVCGAP